MSEPDSASRRPPPTIDLTAKEVKPQQSETSGAAEDRTADAGAAGGRAGRKSSGRVTRSLVAACTGALVMAAVVVGLWMAGYRPPYSSAPATPGPRTAPADEIASRLDKIQLALQTQHTEAPLADRIATAEAATKALADRVAANETATKSLGDRALAAEAATKPLADRLASAEAATKALAERTTAVDAATKSLGDSVAALNRRVDEVAAAAQTTLAQAKAAAATAEAAKSAAQQGVPRGDVEALSNRIAALEQKTKTLADDVTRRPAGADDRAARLSIAGEALRAAVERGEPYQAELAAAKSLGADQSALAALEPFAAGGVPSAAALAHELSQLVPTMQQTAVAVPSEGTFLQRLQNNAQKLVSVTPLDARPGNDAAALLARITADAARADLAAAVADSAKLPEKLRADVEPWIKKVAARDAAVAASRRIVADGLAALIKPASQ